MSNMMDRVELHKFCSEVIWYNRCYRGEVVDVYYCDYEIIDRKIGEKIVHAEVNNLTWMAFNNGAVIIHGIIDGIEYIERY